jgi:hypothetical protein
MMALLKYCQSGAAGLLLLRRTHRSVEEVFVDTAAKMLDAREEEREANGGRTD